MGSGAPGVATGEAGSKPRQKGQGNEETRWGGGGSKRGKRHQGKQFQCVGNRVLQCVQQRMHCSSVQRTQHGAVMAATVRNDVA